MAIDLTDVEDGGNGAARSTLQQVTAERLVDQLELVHRHVWVEPELDRDWLRAQMSVAMIRATALLDPMPPAH
jgi:hypothetical protein